jgi:hypothetical protein
MTEGNTNASTSGLDVLLRDLEALEGLAERLSATVPGRARKPSMR